MTDFRRSLAGRRQSWFGLKRYVKELASYRIPHAVLLLASRRSPALRSGRLPAPRTLSEVTGSVGGNTFVMLRPDRCENAKELYWGGGKRPKPEDQQALELVVRLADGANVFLDVGAYTGLFTIATAVCHPRLTAHAFEIVPAVSDLLVANVGRNGLDDRVVAHREGIGRPGTTMTVPVGEGGSALPSFYSSRMRFHDGVSVPFRSLDSIEDLVDPHDRVVMKIDVEGTEADVLEHGTAFLRRHTPDILCEVLLGPSDPDALNGVLRPLGYRFFLVAQRNVRASDAIRPHARFRDWLFTRRDADALRRSGIAVTDR